MSTPGRPRIPRAPDDDYTREAAERRRAFVTDHTGARLDHVGHFSIDPATLPGNIENFVGVAQVPIGLAGPLVIHGEHARGSFFVPMATTEGTLVASYNRGMRVLTESGGARVTIVKTSMQRAPVFLFDSAREAHDFGRWLEEHFEAIKAAAEATTRVGKLEDIQQFAVGPLLYTRFNFTTGDAAGQNMVSKATLAACEWINGQRPVRFLLSGSIDTDKKHSAINALLTRGRKVIAEAVIPNDVLVARLGVSAATLYEARIIHLVGGHMAGSTYVGAHSANGLTAVFIATGQDVANVTESHAGIAFTKVLENGDYYWSITLPALIVGTYGGGTGLATQREGLEMLGCYGTGGADKLAEICAAVVLAGDISLTGALVNGDWVSSHEQFGRNRP